MIYILLEFLATVLVLSFLCIAISSHFFFKSFANDESLPVTSYDIYRCFLGDGWYLSFGASFDFMLLFPMFPFSGSFSSPLPHSLWRLRIDIDFRMISAYIKLASTMNTHLLKPYQTSNLYRSSKHSRTPSLN